MVRRGVMRGERWCEGSDVQSWVVRCGDMMCQMSFHDGSDVESWVIRRAVMQDQKWSHQRSDVVS